MPLAKCIYEGEIQSYPRATGRRFLTRQAFQETERPTDKHIGWASPIVRQGDVLQEAAAFQFRPQAGTLHQV